MTSTKIREFKDQDKDFCYQVSIENMKPWYKEPEQRKLIDKCLKEKENFVVEQNNTKMAYFCLNIKEKHIYIETFQIKQAFQRQGIGTKIIKFTEDLAKSKNKQRITLHVAKENKNAYNFYKKQNFKTIKEEKVLDGTDSYYMQKLL